MSFGWDNWVRRVYGVRRGSFGWVGRVGLGRLWGSFSFYFYLVFVLVEIRCFIGEGIRGLFEGCFWVCLAGGRVGVWAFWFFYLFRCLV